MQAIVIKFNDDSLNIDDFSLELGKQLADKGLESQISCVSSQEITSLILEKSLDKKKKTKSSDNNSLIVNNVINSFNSFIKATTVEEWLVKFTECKKDPIFRSYLSTNQSSILTYVRMTENQLYELQSTPMAFIIHRALNLIVKINGQII